VTVRPRDVEPPLFRVVAAVLKTMMRLLGWRIRILGVENIPPK
jgi:hypothetical protein